MSTGRSLRTLFHEPRVTRASSPRSPTARCLKRSFTERARAARGGICPRSMDTGMPSTCAENVGSKAGCSRGRLASCRRRRRRPERSRRRWCWWIPPLCGRTSTRPAQKKSRPASPRALARGFEHQNPRRRHRRARVLGIVLTEGQACDAPVGAEMVAQLVQLEEVKGVSADKAYDSKAIRKAWLSGQRGRDSTRAPTASARPSMTRSNTRSATALSVSLIASSSSGRLPRATTSLRPCSSAP